MLNQSNEMDNSASESDENVNMENDKSEDDDTGDLVDDEIEAGPSSKCSNDQNPTKKQRKRGVIYISSIPKHMNVTILREMLGQYAKIGRVFLQPGKLTGTQRLNQFFVLFFLIFPCYSISNVQMKTKREKRRDVV